MPELYVLRGEAYTTKLERLFKNTASLDKPWYMKLGYTPRAYYDGSIPAIVVERESKDNHKLLAHELGHHFRLRHPGIRTKDWWRRDIMCATPPRLTDRRDLLGDYWEWRDAVD